MGNISKCLLCGSIISIRFPIHICKSVKVIDGSNQKLIKRITPEEVNREMKILEMIYSEIDCDCDGDIIVYE
jgi:hypothetical protein